MVSKRLIKELQEILREDYGKDLKTEEVSKIANDLVGYFDLLARIDYRQKEKLVLDIENHKV